MSDSKEQAKPKNKKINRMSNEELEKAIEKTKQNQGTLNSRYGRELLKRKESISVK